MKKRNRLAEEVNRKRFSVPLRLGKLPRRTRRREQASSGGGIEYQGLEQRQVLNGVPVAVDDLRYTVGQNSVLSVSVGNGLLANDFDAEGTALTVASAFVGNHTLPGGQLSVNANGSFTFTPSSGFQGVETWSYDAYDGVSSSRQARVQFLVGPGLSGLLNRDLRVSDNLLHTGGLKLVQPLSDGMQLVYRSDAQGRVVVPVETLVGLNTNMPSSITAQLTFGGIDQGTATYSNSGFAPGQELRFALQATAPASGQYNWMMTVTLVGSGPGGTNLVRQFIGSQAVVNWSGTEYGPGWWMDGQDRLIVQNGLGNRPDGVLLVEGDGRTLWFAKNGATWNRAEGDLTFSNLTLTGSEYTLRDKWGNERRFDVAGFLTSVRKVSDLDTPVYTYAYEPTGQKRLTGITDQFGRVFTLTWINSPAIRVVCGGFGGGRATEVGTPDGNGDVVIRQNVDLQLPVPLYSGYVYHAPLWRYNFVVTNGRSYCMALTAPSEDAGPIAFRTYEYDAFNLLKQVNFHNLPGGTETWKLFPMWAQGLKAPGASNQTLHRYLDPATGDNARYIDERNQTWKFTTNRFGELTRFVDPVSLAEGSGAESKWEFDWYGFLFRETGVDADGTNVSAQIAPVIHYGNSLNGNVLLRRHMGGVQTTVSEQKWTFHGSLNLPLTWSNELNQVTTMTWDAGGNMLSRTDPQGFVWTYQYDEQLFTNAVDQHGRLRTVTSPDPDGVGPLLPLLPQVTTYSYVAAAGNANYLLVSSVTNPDGSSQSFTWSDNDTLTSAKDELNRTTNYSFDDMDRLVLVTQPSVTGGSPQWKFVYGKNGQLNAERDPYDNQTNYSYDARYRMLSQLLPDPDGGGLLTRPLMTWTYDQAGNVIQSTQPEYVAGVKDLYQYDAAGRMTQHTGPLHSQYSPGTGQITEYRYDLRGRLTSIKDPSTRVQRWGYDQRDRLVSTVANDPDDAGPLQGLSVVYGYDAASRLTSIRDELFRQTDYFYTANGWLQSAFLPDPDLTGPQPRSSWGFGYDNLGRRISETNPLGRITATGYDNRDRVSQVTTADPDGSGTTLSSLIWNYQYDVVGNLKTVTAPLGRVTTYDYDSLDRLTQVTLPDPDGAGVGAPASVWQYSQYDLVGNLTAQIDPLLRTTTFVYDSLYRRKTVTQPDPDGSGGSQTSPVWSWNYNDRMLLDNAVDPLLRVTSYGYDNAGRTIAVTNPDPDGAGTGAPASVYTYGFDALDRLISVTEPDPDGVGTGVAPSVTGYQYDQRGRLIQVADARNGLTKYGWNDADELLRLTDPVGNVTEWAYDRMGRRIHETNNAGTATARTRSSEFDPNSNLTRATDRNGRVVTYTLDQLDRLSNEKWYTVSGTVPEVTVTTTTQGATGVNEVQQVDVAQLSAGSPGTFRLAFNGQTTREIAWNANAATVKSALEELAAIGANNVTVTGPTFPTGLRRYVVTFVGALASANQSQIHGSSRYNTDPATADRTLAWTYDNGGRLNGASDPAAIYNYTLDNLDRVAIETQNSSGIGLAPTVRMTRGYDLVGNRTGLAAEFQTGTLVKDFSNAYTFDGLDRNTSITQSAQASGAGFTVHAVQDKRVNLFYNALGQFTFISRYENTSSTGKTLNTFYLYDQANRLTNITHRDLIGSTAANLAVYNLSYDPMNRIKTINHTGPAGGVSDGLSTFNYDQTSQLTLADHTLPRPDESLSYDLNGNRTMAGYGTGANNQTLFNTDSTGQKWSYVYDQEGNRTRRVKLASDGTTVQGYEDATWDHRNRLTSMTFKAASGVVQQSVAYEYDIHNRLIRRTHDSNGAVAGGVLDTFFAGYDGINPTLELSKADPGAGGVASSDLKHRYLWGPVVDQLLANEQLTSVTLVGNTLWTLGDQLGTLRDIVDFNGTSFVVVNHRVYNSFGQLTSQTPSAPQVTFAYTGKYSDAVTSLSLHWHRWLDPSLGKWISEDPIGFLAGDANLARYVQNWVVNGVDPSGADLILRPLTPEETSGQRSFMNPLAPGEFISDTWDGNSGLPANVPSPEPNGAINQPRFSIGPRDDSSLTYRDRAMDKFSNDWWQKYREERTFERLTGEKSWELRRKEQELADATSIQRWLEMSLGERLFSPESGFNLNDAITTMGGGVASPRIPGLVPQAPSLKGDIRLNRQQQRSHILGTPEYQNRTKQGKPTSAFLDEMSAHDRTHEAYLSGRQVPGREGVFEFDFGVPVGVGPNGGPQTRVRVHQKPGTEVIHGHPSGPEGKR